DPLHSFINMHGFAPDWYIQSTFRVGVSLMGFTNPFERKAVLAGTPFPRADPPYSEGSIFLENPDGDEQVVTAAQCDCPGPECILPFQQAIHDHPGAA